MKKAFLILITLLFLASCATNDVVQTELELESELEFEAGEIVYYRSFQLLNDEALVVSFSILLDGIDNVYSLVSVNDSEQVLIGFDHRHDKLQEEWIFPEDTDTIWCFVIGPLKKGDTIIVVFVIDRYGIRYIFKESPYTIIFSSIEIQKNV